VTPCQHRRRRSLLPLFFSSIYTVLTWFIINSIPCLNSLSQVKSVWKSANWVSFITFKDTFVF
jgi:hypothetical protein